MEVTIDIQTTPEAIISAFIEPNMLNDWWGVERTRIDKKPGGLYTLAWNISDKGFGFVSTGIIKDYQPGKELIIDNLVYLNPDKPFLGPMKLTIRVKEKSKLTELYLCQDGYQSGSDWDWYYDAVKQAWPNVLKGLKDYLEKS